MNIYDSLLLDIVDSYGGIATGSLRDILHKVEDFRGLVSRITVRSAQPLESLQAHTIRKTFQELLLIESCKVAFSGHQ